jgi:hypothetical protein
MPVVTLRIGKSGTLEPTSTSSVCVQPRPFGVGRFGVGLYSRYQPGEWPAPPRCKTGTWEPAEMCGCMCGATTTTAARRP